MLNARLEALREEGWVALPGVMRPDEATAVADRCARLNGQFRDKAAGGTRRLVDLAERVPAVAAAIHGDPLALLVQAALPGAELTEVALRCPNPGYGRQKFHVDDVALDATAPWRVVVAIVALCEFTPANGATGIIPGSHRRPDLQRRSGSFDTDPDEVVARGPAGTAFVLCGHVLHHGRQNRSDRPRPAIQAVWRRALAPGAEAPARRNAVDGDINAARVDVG